MIKSLFNKMGFLSSLAKALPIVKAISKETGLGKKGARLIGGALLGDTGANLAEQGVGLAGFRKGGKIRKLGKMPSMRIGGRVKKGSKAAKAKMAMLRNMKK
jgi:hypothetical protein